MVTGCWDRLLGEKADGGVGSGREDPGLRRVKGHVQNPEVVSNHMTSEDLDWDNERVLQQVAGGEGGVWGVSDYLCVIRWIMKYLCVFVCITCKRSRDRRSLIRRQTLKRRAGKLCDRPHPSLPSYGACRK